MKILNNPTHDVYHRILNDYYDSPVMTKIKDVGDDVSMYAVQLPCFLLNEKRYLIALCNRDSASAQQLPFNDLCWTSLQIRSLYEEELPDMQPHAYQIKRSERFMVPLVLLDRTKKYTRYTSSDDALIVTLLHTRNLEFEYPNNGNLVAALETFQTIIQWKN